MPVAVRIDEPAMWFISWVEMGGMDDLQARARRQLPRRHTDIFEAAPMLSLGQECHSAEA
jgi:hypothetical protein